MADDSDDAADLAAEELPPAAKKKRENKYKKIIEEIFSRNFKAGMTEFEFDREDIENVATQLGHKVKNLGDVVYTFRYRKPLPKAILDTQPEGLYWLILGAGDARYRFRLSSLCYIEPRPGLLVRKIPDATPEIITRYALGDEQALLAKVRYNRLIDIFLGVTAYSLQNHLRTKIPNYGQIEIDELYVGVDSQGVQYVIPVQAKGGNDKLGVIQTIQDVTFCQTQERYKDCVPRTVSAQFMKVGGEDVIAMFELTFDGNDVSIRRESHYRLVANSEISAADLQTYKVPDAP